MHNVHKESEEVDLYIDIDIEIKYIDTCAHHNHDSMHFLNSQLPAPPQYSKFQNLNFFLQKRLPQLLHKLNTAPKSI